MAEIKLDAVATRLITWLRRAVLIAILVLLSVALLKAFGVKLPLPARIGHVELAYLAGVYWLTKG